MSPSVLLGGTQYAWCFTWPHSGNIARYVPSGNDVYAKEFKVITSLQEEGEGGIPVDEVDNIFTNDMGQQDQIL